MYDHIAAGHLADDRIAELKRTAEIVRLLAEAESVPFYKPRPSLIAQIWHRLRGLAAGSLFGHSAPGRAS